MMETFLKAAMGMTLVLIAWLGVQSVWRRSTGTTGDALAGRMGCRNCECESICQGDNTQAGDNTGAKR